VLLSALFCGRLRPDEKTKPGRYQRTIISKATKGRVKTLPLEAFIC